MFKKINYLILLFVLSTFIFGQNILAQNTKTEDVNYFIDEAKIFENDLINQKAINAELQGFNNSDALSFKIITVKNLSAKSDTYCHDIFSNFTKKRNQVALIYDEQNNNMSYCLKENNTSTIATKELDYIIEEKIKKYIDANNIVYAIRIGASYVSQASIGSIIPNSYHELDMAKKEVLQEERNKQIIGILLIIILFSWLAAALGRTKAWWLGGLIGFFMGFFIWWISDIWFFMPLLLLTGLAYDHLVSSHYKEYQTCTRGKFWCSPYELKELEEEKISKQKKK